MMFRENISLFILFIFIENILSIPSNSYYLINIDTTNSFNPDDYCSNISMTKDFYHLPHHCHRHLLCDPYNCDDRSFRCVKIRETLCCLFEYSQKYCSKENFKDQFRSIYFSTSIQHGYCEINLERIEQNDQSYCLADHPQTTTTSLTRLPLKRFYRYRQRSSKPTTMSSTCSFLHTNFIMLVLSVFL